MKRSAANICWSNESCENSHSNMLSGGNRVCIQNDNNECSFSSESSCGQGFHVRKRRKGHHNLECSLIDGRNNEKTKYCCNAVLQEAEIGHNCCPCLKDSTCPMKGMHVLNPAVSCNINWETCDHQCSLEQKRCQHCVSCHIPTICLPSCESRNGFHNDRVSDQEKAQLSPSSFCKQKGGLLVWRQHADCACNLHHNHDCDGLSCQQHKNSAGVHCRSECRMEMLNLCACIKKGRSEKDLASMGIHGSGDCCQDKTTNRDALAAKSLKDKDKSLLTSKVARPPDRVIEDFKVDDIGLGRPGGDSSGKRQICKQFDMDNTIDDDPKSFIDICAPATPFSQDSERKFHGFPRTDINDKGLKNIVTPAYGGNRIQGNTVVLDDSDDELKESVIQEGMQGNEMEDIQLRRSVSLLSDRGAADGTGLCRTDDMVATKHFGHHNEIAERFDTKSDKLESVSAIPKSRLAMNKGINPQIFEVTEQIVTMALNTHTSAMQSDVAGSSPIAGSSPRGFRPRKKCMVDKKSLPLFDLDAIDDEQSIYANVNPINGQTHRMTCKTTTTHDLAYPSNSVAIPKANVQTPAVSKIVEAKPRMWESGTICDLCRKGLSLSLGDWYAWCCGLPLDRCSCSLDVKMRFTLAMNSKKINKSRKMDAMVWSGKVHKMCALWSSEVYEDGNMLVGLSNAVRRGKLLLCAACKEYGATLGCRVKTCRRSFHYPCADELASKLCCRMWDGVYYPVACRGHRYVPMTCQNAKEKPPNLKKWRFRGFVSRSGQTQLQKSSSLANAMLKAHPTTGTEPFSQQKLGEAIAKEKYGESSQAFIDISTDSEGDNKASLQDLSSLTVDNSSHFDMYAKGCQQSTIGESGQSWIKDTSVALYHMGNNLLSEDISGGREAVLIPCTNDIDSDPAPVVSYIIENRYLGRAKDMLDSLLQNNTLRAAPICSGCNINDMDDPNVKPSVHSALSNCQRENDTRYDWQGQSMLGRLPYDQFGRLQLGPQTKDIIECNSRCPCGLDCLNKELQRGIQLPLEVFKTKDRGWGVRTMEQICRGKFVMEYIGEVLTHDEAYVRGVQYDLSNSSCLFSADHPDVPAEDLLVIDGYQMSNVARFINHSCDGNLRVYRVYSETTDLRFCRIGLYALRDIEIGEELSYDYSYVTSEDTANKDFSTDPTAIKCLCGASNCRQWLWTGTSR